MRYSLPYSADAAIEIEVPASATVIDCTAPRGAVLADPANALISSLAEPLHYPPLAMATVPGDHIALVAEPGLPQIEALVGATIYSLLEAGASPRDISVVVASNRRPPLALVPERVRDDLRVVLHNPGDQEGLQYLAADKAARPIYLNRVLCEADFVLPLSMPRLTSSLAFAGGYHGLFPTFADLETQRRFRAPSSADHAAQQKHRREEADGAIWQLGVHFLTQIVPGRGDDVLHVVTGQANDVIKEAAQRYEAAWLHSIPEKAGLTIAAIDGDEDQQTWDNFARGLDAAMQATSEGGALILLSNLEAPIGPALALLAGNERDELLKKHLEQAHSPDAQTAALLAEARERFDVFLMTSLPPGMMEELGVAEISDPGEIARLAKRYSSVLLLGSAQHAGCRVVASE